MIVTTLRAENVYNKVSAISAITSLCELFSIKPDEKSTPVGSYAYITIVTNNPASYSNIGYLMKTARVSFHIVCKKTLGSTDTPERVLATIIDTITNNLVSFGQSATIDGFICQSIVEDTVSPIFFADNRHYVVKDYLFNYSSLTDE